jgi:hypothetical protein
LPAPTGVSDLRKPQIALRLIPGFVRDSVRRISWGILRPDPGHVLPEPCRRPPPAHPLGQHRRRHPRVLQQQRRITGLDPGVLRNPDICWRTVSAGCLRHGVTGDPQPRSYRLINSPSARCNRRISAQSSTVITYPIVWNGWLSIRPSPTPSPCAEVPSCGWLTGAASEGAHRHRAPDLGCDLNDGC